MHNLSELLSKFLLLNGKMIGGIDFGKKKFGIAISNQTYSIATPTLTYTRKTDSDDMKFISEFINKNNIGLIIVGFPDIKIGGNPLYISEIEEFANQIKLTSNCEVHMQDESFSTKDAIKLLRQSGLSRKRTKKLDDATAAAIILQRALDLTHSIIQTNKKNVENEEMKLIIDGLYVGSQNNFFELMQNENWVFVQAAREPFFLKECDLKYISSEKEPLFVIKQNLIALNLSDSRDESTSELMIMASTALRFIKENLDNDKNVLVHCNHGVSRSPSIALMYVLKNTGLLSNKTFAEIIETYKSIYPKYNPTNKMLNMVAQFIEFNEEEV